MAAGCSSNHPGSSCRCGRSVSSQLPAGRCGSTSPSATGGDLYRIQRNEADQFVSHMVAALRAAVDTVWRASLSARFAGRGMESPRELVAKRVHDPARWTRPYWGRPREAECCQIKHMVRGTM